MGLIKAETAPAVVRFKWRDIQDEAQKLLEAASVQADSIRDAAREDGFRQGHSQGVMQGRDESLRIAIDEQAQRIESALSALEQAAAEVMQTKQKLQADMVCEMVKLAIAIARRVTKRQAMLDPQVLVENLREALALAGRSRQLRIALHPAQHEILAAALPQLSLEWPALSAAQIVPDASLSAGGCRVFTEHGIIDADLESQLDRVVGGLMPCQSQEVAA
jgi:flagellar assembly protein FliH